MKNFLNVILNKAKNPYDYGRDPSLIIRVMWVFVLFVIAAIQSI